MSTARLQQRVPSAVPLGCHTLKQHDLRFHKLGSDGSAKCDAYCTANNDNMIYGALFEMDPAHKPLLDRAEGLGHGYDEKEVVVIATDGTVRSALTYVATCTDVSLRPYTWYVNHVLVGAAELELPEDYIASKITGVEAIADMDRERDARERAVHGS